MREWAENVGVYVDHARPLHNVRVRPVPGAGLDLADFRTSLHVYYTNVSLKSTWIIHTARMFPVPEHNDKIGKHSLAR